MPPASKPTQRKSGAPKAKGSVRAKSGCYTCRIRRKKCDERPDPEGNCETCVRLRLQCLGFGTKRPEWLRENSKVLAIREKIKTFLASQGMIKGHSGTGPRGAEDSVFLRLTNEDYSSASESPQSQILTLSSSSEDFRPAHHTSNMRDQNWGSTSSYHAGGSLLQPQSYYRASPGSVNTPPSPPHQQLRPSSPPYDYDMPYSYQHTSNSSTSLVPTQWHALALSPTIASSFGPHYQTALQEDEFDLYATSDSHYLPRQPIPDDLLNHYMKTVVGLQYLLADDNKFPHIISKSVEEIGFSRQGARLLSYIHTTRTSSNPQRPALESVEAKEEYERLREMLNQTFFNDNDAMASLHVVSSFLFDGGKGEWEEWLNVAYMYCDNILSRHTNLIEALFRSSDIQRFLIKTTIWFDVLASVTTLRPPHFLMAVRAFCDPTSRSSIYDPTMDLEGELSMMSVMGCENRVVLALAETSALAAWKANQIRKGCLSMPELVSKGSDIERHLTMTHNSVLQPALIHEMDVCRRSTNDIFRSSARVYLRSVVSGDHPSVPEIVESVQDTITCFENMPPDSTRVVRSTVFALFITGCLTDNTSHRNLILQHLNTGGGAGNCNSVKMLLEEVWRKRTRKGDTVPWRQMLCHEKLLLV